MMSLSGVHKPVDSKKIPRLGYRHFDEYFVNLRKLFARYEDRDLTTEDRSRMLDELKEVIGAAKEGFDISIVSSINPPLTRERSLFLARRIADNIPAIRKGSPLSLDEESGPPGWNYGVIEEVHDTATKQGLRTELVIRLVHGLWAGGIIRFRTSDKGCWVIGANIGFSRKDKKLSMGHRKFLSRMNIAVFISYSDNRPYPHVMRYGVTSTQKKENRKLIRERKNSICPKNVKPKNCLKCHFGTDQCSQAVRPATLVIRHCTWCHSDQFFDPRYRNGCMICRSKKLKKDVKELFYDQQRKTR